MRSDGVEAPLERAVAGLTSYGPFFALDVPALGPDVLALDEPAFGALVAARVAATRERLGSREARACASLVHLDLVSRLVSPAVGCAVAGVVPPLSPARARCRRTVGGVRFGLAPAAQTLVEPGEPTGAALADAFARIVLPTAALITRAVDAHVPLPRHVTGSNVASAIGGAVTVVAAVRPEAAPRARQLFAALLEHPDLAGAGALVGPPGRARFRRNGCCLYYRLPGGGLCGDCVLSAAPSRRARRRR